MHKNPISESRGGCFIVAGPTGAVRSPGILSPITTTDRRTTLQCWHTLSHVRDTNTFAFLNPVGSIVTPSVGGELACQKTDESSAE